MPDEASGKPLVKVLDIELVSATDGGNDRLVVLGTVMFEAADGEAEALPVVAFGWVSAVEAHVDALHPEGEPYEPVDTRPMTDSERTAYCLGLLKAAALGLLASAPALLDAG